MTAPDHPVDVVAIGNAIVDVLARCDDALLAQLALTKGSMSLVDTDRAAEVYAAMGAAVEVSGGSAANTATAVASLGGRAAFIGKVVDDALGRVFAPDIRASGVTFTTPAGSAGSPTARCLVLVTPDGQRTMATHLGVAGELSPADIDTSLIGRSRVTFVEGYLVGLPTAEAALAAAIASAHRAGGRVALTLSDSTWVAARREHFVALLPEVDILLANEEEACELTGEADAEAAIEQLARCCAVVAVTRSERGALVMDNSGMTAVPAQPVDSIVDTTGAGDLFAAGFLLGLARGRGAGHSAHLGVRAAAAVLGHLGARPQRRLADLVEATDLPEPVR